MSDIKWSSIEINSEFIALHLPPYREQKVIQDQEACLAEREIRLVDYNAIHLESAFALCLSVCLSA